ncbi:hypothetical protein ACN28G_14645 [Micromonospora sp. WMMA1923]|uniref:hypothetical protein n=1 Tax=Micromonospora sp. WMMA1923 TaxID=3404125 RepID=UPI003B95DF73
MFSIMLVAPLSFTVPASANIRMSEAAVSAEAACVHFVRWGTSGVWRTVTVRNSCGSKKCYRVDVPGVGDPLKSVAAYATETDEYIGTILPQGRGIYEASC